MTADGTRRVIDQEALGALPEGLLARATAAADVPAITALLRSIDVAGCGRSTANPGELTAWLSDPHVGWERGSATIWRDEDVVGYLLVEDALHESGGWTIDVNAKPGDRQQRTLFEVLIDAGLTEGQQRWAAMASADGTDVPIARAASYANDDLLRSALEQRGFAEVRRYWQMRIDHQAPGQDDPKRPDPPVLAAGYTIRPAHDTEEELRALHTLDAAAFVEHFDFIPSDFDTWAARMRMDIEDPALWLVAEHDGALAGFALGSNRYASEGYGYVGTLAVDRRHRGKGLARALLLARFEADRGQGLRGTLLDVDSQNTTGATRLYRSVGMDVSAEYVGFHRPLPAERSPRSAVGA